MEFSEVRAREYSHLAYKDTPYGGCAAPGKARTLPLERHTGQRAKDPSHSAPNKRRGRHVVGAEQRWRELRAQGAQIDAAARAAPPRRRLEAVPAGKRGGQQAPGGGWGGA